MNKLKLRIRKMINFIYIGNTWGMVLKRDTTSSVAFSAYILKQLQTQTRLEEFTSMTIFKIEHAVSINDGTTIVNLICQTTKQDWLMDDILYVDHIIAIEMWRTICAK